MLRSLAILTFLVFASVACSGGGGGGGSSDEGGIGGSGITRGVITQLGSVTVARTNYDTDTESAVVVLDGEVMAAIDLQIGMKVTIEGTRDEGGATGTATRVEFDDDLQGRIEDILEVDFDIDGLSIAAELTIFDRTVLIERGLTLFEGTDFDAIAVLDFVEVSGFAGTDGVITATRIAAKGAPDVELRGVVSNHVENGVDSSFDLGDVEILYDSTGGTDLSGVPGGVLGNGNFVEVEGDFVDVENVDATMGSIEIEETEFSEDFDDFEVEGIVTDFVSLASFRLGGLLVDAGSFGVIFDPDFTIVEDGALLEVEGRLEGGVLIAEEVELRESEARVSAEIADTSDIDVAAGTFVLLGVIEIQVDSGTRFDPCFEVMDLDGLDKLAGGDFVEVRGVDLNPPAETLGIIRATRIECGAVDDVELRGRVQKVDPGPRTFTILGLEIPVDGLTEFEGFPDDPDLTEEEDFFAFIGTVSQALLEVEDEDDGDATTLDVADEVESAED